MGNTKKRKVQQTSLDFENDFDSDTEDTVVEMWPRFLVVHSKDESRPVTRLHPFLVGKTLQAAGGKVEASRLRSGDLLLKSQSKRQSENLLKLKKIGETEVEVTPHRTMNTSRGVIRDEALAELDDKELISCLKGQGVVAAKRFLGKRGGREVRLPTIVLTFGTPELPERVWAGFYYVRVKPYVPLPLRCYKCQRYGHGSAQCKKEAICFRCGEKDHEGSICQADSKCVNCNGSHMSSSRDCPKWKEECEIQKIRTEKKVSFPEARRLAGMANQKTTTSFAQVVAAKATKSVGMQTEPFMFSTQPPSSALRKTTSSQSTRTTNISNSKLDIPAEPVVVVTPPKVTAEATPLVPGAEPGKEVTGTSSSSTSDGGAKSFLNSYPKHPLPLSSPCPPKPPELPPKPKRPEKKAIGPPSARLKKAEDSLPLKNLFDVLADIEMEVEPGSTPPTKRPSPKKDDKKKN